MLTEERYATILRILKEKQAVTVPELTRALCTSESTIRRDLTALHKRGMLYKVYGGATSIDSNYTAMEEDMPTKSSRCTEEKIAIARRAASLVTRKDFVYIDAGSTTLHMVDFLQERQAVYVTNGLPHASRLSLKGFKVFLLGGASRPLPKPSSARRPCATWSSTISPRDFSVPMASASSPASPRRTLVKGSSRARPSRAVSTPTCWPISRSSTRSRRSPSPTSRVRPSSPDI